MTPASAGPTPTAPSGSRRLSVTLLCLAALALLGWIDFRTGYELGFFVFYSAPVGLAAWYAGRWPAVIVALGASFTWWLADRLNGVRDSSGFYLSWNLSIHFAAFLINAITISRIKRDVDERAALLAEVDRLRAAAPINRTCLSCGQPVDRPRPD